MDPCGSLVVTGLDWETSGGLAHRDTGLYRDFSVRFDAEVKKFPTQFAPALDRMHSEVDDQLEDEVDARLV